MANRIGTFPTFANLSPPWSLPTLDSNFVSVNTAINDSSLGFVNGIATDTGSVNSYQVTCPFGAPTAYNAGMTVAFVPANNNTGASVIQVLPLSGTVAIVDIAGNPLKANALVANNAAFLILIGTQFRLINTVAPIFSNSYVLTVAGTTVVNLNGYTDVSLTIDSTGAPSAATITFTLNNVAFGATFYINWTPITGGLQTFKISSASTDQNGNTIANITTYDTPSGTVNLTTAGYTGVGTYAIFDGGMSFATQGPGTAQLRFLSGFR